MKHAAIIVLLLTLTMFGPKLGAAWAVSLNEPFRGVHFLRLSLVIASLAWSLKAWSALMIPASGQGKARHMTEKHRLLDMDFTTFQNAMIQVPAQIIRSGRKIIYRMLSWNRWQEAFFRLLDQLNQPLRC